jgi:GntR family transcriptional regulator, transcriptional repressor for pyruvate dehydrogenase complex
MMTTAGRAETTADALIGLVLDGTFPPGSSLPSEAELASRFAVSRLTVREAIRSLESTQVIRVQQGRSSTINPTDQWSALDPRLLKARGQASGEPLRLPKRLHEARRVIEVAIAELAAARRTDEHLERMAAAIASQEEAHDRGDVPRFVEADLAFHEVLFGAADNAFLEALVQPLAAVLRDQREETASASETREHAIEFHARILRRVGDRDAEGAGEEMREHLILTEEYTERFQARVRRSPAAS